MNETRIGVAAGIVSLLAFAVQNGPSIAIDRWLDGAGGAALPTIGSMGQTVVTYTVLATIAGPLVTLGAAFGLGYAVAKRREIAQEYRRFVGAVAVGSAAGVVLAAAPLLAGGVTAWNDAFSALLVLATFASLLVSVALPVTVGAVAGAAIAHFRTIDDGSSGPTSRDTDSPTGSSPDATDDTAGTRSPVAR